MPWRRSTAVSSIRCCTNPLIQVNPPGRAALTGATGRKRRTCSPKRPRSRCAYRGYGTKTPHLFSETPPVALRLPGLRGENAAPVLQNAPGRATLTGATGRKRRTCSPKRSRSRCAYRGYGGGNAAPVLRNAPGRATLTGATGRKRRTCSPKRPRSHCAYRGYGRHCRAAIRGAVTFMSAFSTASPPVDGGR